MKKQTAVVVIPTFNEAESIKKMVDHLCLKTFPKAENWQCKILIVDGNSPDGTADVVKKKMAKFKNVDLLVEKKKEGIGAAYVKGFRRAIKNHKADVLIEFDGDFQHPPDTIPVMLAEIGKGADYVLGSRKIKGGSNPEGWGFKRVFFSEVGGLAARLIMFFPFKPFFAITDPTTGLKASRVKGFVDKMEMDNLYSKKFGYKLEFLYQMVKFKAVIKEIPLKFGLRTVGESKITSGTAKDIFRTAILLRWFDSFTQKFLKFATVGGVGFLVNIIGAKLFKELLVENVSWSISLVNGLANAMAAELAIISNFIGNNLWTFSQEKITKAGQLISKFLTFNLSSIITGIVIPSLVIALLTTLFGDYLLLYQVIAILGLTVPLNWIIYNKVIWKKK